MTTAMMRAPDISELLRIKAESMAGMGGCPRCRGFTVIEKIYVTIGPVTEAVWQFRCTSCGWCDDIRNLHALAAREVERQEQRAATEDAPGFSATRDLA